MFCAVDETCYGISAGDVRIDYSVSNCEGMGSYNAYNGWNSNRQMIIMEVTQTDQGKSIYRKLCSSHPNL